MLTSLFISLIASAHAVSAAPAQTGSRCDLSKVTLTIPASSSGTPLAAPIAATPEFVGVGVGTQNYTCNAQGTYVSAGAYAELFDVSCLPSSDSYETIIDIASAAWSIAPASWTAAKVIQAMAELKNPSVLGQHYFVTNAAGGLSPKWDFTSASEAGHADAFVIGAKTGDIPAPTNPTKNIDWLSLSAASGDLATQVYRLQTRGGQPPSTCTVGSPEIFVKYVSLYGEHFKAIV
ncbi:hypothetical protein BC835DRAFT_1271280 [Cytidiella melzeri]|nr:hypothetical protein BC835DRAFT_1271280 [Cytidiella melzeri]